MNSLVLKLTLEEEVEGPAELGLGAGGTIGLGANLSLSFIFPVPVPPVVGAEEALEVTLSGSLEPKGFEGRPVEVEFGSRVE